MMGVLFNLILPALAAAGSAYPVKVTTFPARPYVLSSDANQTGAAGDPVPVPAPWFKVDVRIENNGDEVVMGEGIEFRVQSAEGKIMRYRQAKVFAVQPNDFLVLPAVYLGALPVSNQFEYKVTVRPLTYHADSRLPIDLSTQFTTQ